MKRIRISVLLVLVLSWGSVLSQTENDSLLAKDNVMIPLPTISINFGFNHLMSDVLLAKEGPSPFRQFGYQLSITQRAAKFLNVTLDLYTGTVYGEEQRNQTNLNFRTTLFSQHLNVEYNFYPLLKPDASGRQLIRPYVGIGIGAIFFRSKGDLKDGSGADYNYWSDGLIYAEAEGSINQSEATPLSRDFEYETDLRDANLDGLRKYPQTAFSLPINAGIRFQITKNIGVNAAFAYALNFSDMLDNVSESGTGDRLGSAGNDNHLYGSIGLSVFLGQTKPSSKPKKPELELLADNSEGSHSESALENSSVQNATLAKANSESLTLEEAKQKSASEIIEQSTSPTLANTRKVEVSEDLASELSTVEKNNTEVAKKIDELKESAKSTNKKPSSKEKKNLTNAIESQSAILKELKSIASASQSLNTEGSNDKTGSQTVDAIEDNLDKLALVKEEALKIKTSAGFIKVTESLVDINSATTSDIDSETQATEAELAKQKLNALEDRVSLYEFVRESEDLNAEDQANLDELQTKLKQEIDSLTETGAIPESRARALTEALSNQPNELANGTEQGQTSSQNLASSDKENSTNVLIPEEAKNQTTEPDANVASSNTSSEPKKTPTTEEIENTPPKKSGGFHWADLNQNGWISPDEVLHFIDLLFEGEAVRTVEDIQNLIDYYFDQE